MDGRRRGDRVVPTVGRVKVCVDVEEILALTGLLRDAAEDSGQVGVALGASSAASSSGLAVGARAVQDAVDDLVRQWVERADDVAGTAGTLRALVAEAAEEYARCETQVDRTVQGIRLVDLSEWGVFEGPVDVPMETGLVRDSVG